MPEPTDPYAERFGKPLFSSLWEQAWGEQYPSDVQPYSSCTNQLLGQLAGELDLPEGSTLADFGCGTGGAGLWLARELGLQLIGLDISEPGVGIARRRAGDWLPEERARFLVADFADCGLADNCVDAVVSIDALPFARDLDAAFREIHRILRPGGRLLFTTRELSRRNPRWPRTGPACSVALTRNDFRTLNVIVRPDVSALWRRLYDLWVEYETGLREELSDETVDGLMEEAWEIGPRLGEHRDWLLVVAGREGRAGS